MFSSLVVLDFGVKWAGNADYWHLAYRFILGIYRGRGTLPVEHFAQRPKQPWRCLACRPYIL